MRPHILVLLTTISLQVAAQGTAEDYRRAYALYDQLKSSNVYHWAHDVRWKDSTHVFSYRIDTPDGPQYYNYNADSLLKKVVPPPPAQMPKPRFGRHQERHWMEVDEEKFPMPVLSPDGRTEAYIEGHNVVLHPAGKPYSEKKVLSQDGTIGEYYSNRILWSPDSRYLFVCKRRPVDKRYVHYVESSPSDQLQPILHRQEYAKPGDALPFKTPVIFDTQTGEKKVGSTALCSHQYELGTFAWTPDSKEVTMEYNERGHKTYRILAMNAQTGTIRTVIEEKLKPMMDVGLHYLHLNQALSTLSGGELQRLKIASYLQQYTMPVESGGQRGVFVIDEPTDGLHLKDVRHLIELFEQMVDMTVYVIEHNTDVIKAADYVIELGPGAGDLGGNIIYHGTPRAMLDCPSSITAAYL